MGQGPTPTLPTPDPASAPSAKLGREMEKGEGPERPEGPHPASLPLDPASPDQVAASTVGLF